MTAKAENSGKLRTAQEDERLRELAVSSATPSEIAEKLNRTESATKARAYVLRVGLRRFGARRRDLSKWAEGEETVTLLTAAECRDKAEQKMVEAMNAADPRQHHELEATAKAWLCLRPPVALRCYLWGPVGS